MDFQDKVHLIAAVFGLVDKEKGQPHFLTEEQREASFMPYTVFPDETNYDSFCQEANSSYQLFLDVPPVVTNDIITWRAKYIALYDYCIKHVSEPSEETILFLDNYDDSILYFNQLLEKK
jgi:hypothetical protein